MCISARKSGLTSLEYRGTVIHQGLNEEYFLLLLFYYTAVIFIDFWFLQKRIEDLKKERKTVEDQIAMAEDELQETEDLVKMLADSKMVCLTTYSVCMF